jgi:hypothetical protein
MIAASPATRCGSVWEFFVPQAFGETTQVESHGGTRNKQTKTAGQRHINRLAGGVTSEQSNRHRHENNSLQTCHYVTDNRRWKSDQSKKGEQNGSVG